MMRVHAMENLRYSIHNCFTPSWIGTGGTDNSTRCQADHLLLLLRSCAHLLYIIPGAAAASI
jgi:hypothetical protein